MPRWRVRGLGGGLTVVVEQKRLEPLAHVPFDIVVGEHAQHAQEYMRPDPIGGIVEDGPHFEIHGLEASEGPHEGACRNVVASRLKRGGMRWTVARTDAILALRSCIVSDRFDDFWQRRTGAK